MKTLLSFAALAAFFPLAPAAADGPARTQTVVYRDLDLGSAAGRATLDRRIGRAAETLCGEASDYDLAGQRRVARCRQATAADALAQVAGRRLPVQVAATGH